MHIAIIYGNKQVVVELLQNEADPNTKNEASIYNYTLYVCNYSFGFIIRMEEIH